MENSTVHSDDHEFEDTLSHNNNNMQPENKDKQRDKKETKQNISQKQYPGMLHQVFDKIEDISDKITDFLPVWAKMIGKLQEMTGYRKRYILLAMVKIFIFLIRDAKSSLFSILRNLLS